jgi:hypothetical protein
MYGSGLADPRVSRAARRRLAAVVGGDLLDEVPTPDLYEHVQHLLVDAFLDDRLTVRDYRIFIDAFSVE